MLMMEPEHYFAEPERCEEKKRIINIIGAQEDKNGSLVSHLISTFKGFMTSNQHQDLDEALKASSAESLKSHARRQLIKSSMTALDGNAESQNNPSLLSRHRHKAALKIATFKATKMYGKTILTAFTLYSVTVFSLNLSWNLTTADVSSDMLDILEIMNVLLHAIFFLWSFFIWNGASLQSYVDAAISIILPFANWYYKVQSSLSLSTGQVIMLSLLTGYITFRLYQKTLATVAQHTLKESVEHLRFIWSVRTVKIARQILPEINETYESLVKEWGEAMHERYWMSQFRLGILSSLQGKSFSIYPQKGHQMLSKGATPLISRNPPPISSHELLICKCRLNCMQNAGKRKNIKECNRAESNRIFGSRWTYSVSEH
mmetsp:Transcript_4070/g.6203  ORF Transcript_4070/g.6203 Transcript_4070/m.6203 type:complete len:374 (-) Transcript_4070:152-1273(-)